MKEKIVYTALENLKKHTGIEGTYTTNHNKVLDGEVNFVFQNGNEIFVVEVMQEIRNHQLPIIEEKAKGNKNFMLIAETIFPKIKEELHKRGIAYIDIAGNIYLQTATHYLWIEGNKSEHTKIQKPNRVFKVAGLKLIYLFLINERLLNQPQRIIAEESGIALGNINYILNGLKEQEFLIQKGKKELQIINQNELLQKWINGYEEKLKPTLHMGNFNFAKADDEINWKQLKLKPNQTFWGGEPAADIITQYLQPEEFTIYTDENRNNLIKSYRFIPEQNGKIKVYKKFWQNDVGCNEMLVHPLLTYADLVNTGNNRCIETAKIIYDKYINKNF